MTLELRSPLQKYAFAGVCLICIPWYLLVALHTYQAAHLASVPELPYLQKAIRIEPSNAEYHDLLGRARVFSIEGVGEAIENYRIAVRLNPYEAAYWLDLAGAYQISGQTQEQRDSIVHAVEVDPTTPHVAWEAANFFLVQGDRENAFRQFRMVLTEDPERADAALQLCWRATEDASVMLEKVLPPQADRYLSFLRLLIQKQQTASAENVWDRLIALKQPFSVSLAFPYLRFLLAQREITSAQAAWQQLAKLNRSLEPYLPSRDNLIVNGGFEEDLLNGGFDWWYQRYPQVALAIDTDEFHSGTRSLSITFDGRSAPDAGISQFVPVKPDTDYEFSGHFRSEDLDTASGPRFAIADAYSGVLYVLSDDALGSNPWRSHIAEFHTGPSTNLISLKIIRQPATPLIRGKLWIDDVRLVETSKQGLER